MFIMGGFMFHLGQREMAIAGAKEAGAPMPRLGVPLTGVTNIVGGFMVILGVWGDVGALILAVNVFLFAIFMHAFWKETDPQAQNDQMQNFLKNMTILGGLLVLFWAFNQAGDTAPLTLTDPLFDRFD